MKYISEYRSRFRILKGGKISLIVSALAGSITILSAAPSGGLVTSGSATINQSGVTTNITQSTNKATINWQNFSVAGNETVNFYQPSVNAIALNRVIGNEKSIIDGALNANGQVWILNSSGVLFGKDAHISTAGLLATTASLSDADFNAGSYSFKSRSAASIINMGTIEASDSGYVALLANTVSNEGTIKAIKGVIHLSGANDATINLNGNSLVSLKIDKGVLDALVENKGVVIADGGQIYLTTNAVDELLYGVVNNTGIIEANSIDDVTGKIELFAHGGSGEYDGTLNAKGGFVETSGKVLHVSKDIVVKAKEWLLDPTNINITDGGGGDIGSSSMDADVITTALSSGTNVTLTADNDINVNEAITWAAATQLKLAAGDEVYVNATIQNTNATGGGVYFQAANTDNKVIFGTDGKVIINNPYQLQWMNTALMGKYELGSNINASITSTWNGGAGFVPIGSHSLLFKGTFNGLDHTIDGLFINRPSIESGLFGNVNHSVISNIGLTNVNITGDDKVGALIGYNFWGSVTNSYATGSVHGDAYVGGLVGDNEGYITNSYATVSVSGSLYVGGFAGENERSIANSYATGSVNGYGEVGGFVGSNYDTIDYSYATGRVSGNNRVGGLVGYNNGVRVAKSYWDIDSTGRTVSSGGIGIHSSTDTINAYVQSTYAEFDFTNTWFMLENYTRPFLRSEYSTTITNAHQLQLVSMQLDADYTLANNINLASSLTNQSDMWKGLGSNATNDFQGSFVAVGSNTSKFTGSFDGLEHIVENLTINRPSSVEQGLFGMTDLAVISNIGLANVNITGDGAVGGLIGFAERSTITNSYTTGTVNGSVYIGGLIGHVDTYSAIANSYASVAVSGSNEYIGGLVGVINNSSAVIDSYAMGSVSGSNRVGGLIGASFSDSTVLSSYATGEISGADMVGGLVGVASRSIATNNHATGRVSGNNRVGGLVGFLDNYSTVSNSYATGNVDGNSNAIGGLIGYSTYYSTVSNSYAIGEVSGNSFIGGLVGINYNDSTVSNSYATGEISGADMVGGLVGQNSYSVVTSSYATGAVNGSSNVGGLVGYGDNSTISESFWNTQTTRQTVSAGGTGKTNAEMQTHSTFANWDISGTGADGSVWRIYEGYTSPLLRSFLTQASSLMASKVYDGLDTIGANALAWTPSVDSSKIYGIGRIASKDVGTHVLTGFYSDQHGYDIVLLGNITITKANATITANSDSKTYNGQTQSVSGFSASGLVNGETVAVLDGVSTSGGSGVNAGEYILTPSGTDENYNLTFANGKLIINKANATITANSDSKTYNGQTQSVSGFSASGLVNGETVAVLDGVSGATANGTNAGTYTTNLAGSDENYNLTFTNGSLIITKANATITANSDSKTYNGQTQSVSGFSASGLVNGETVAVLDGVSGATANGTNAGTYTTNLAGSDENYNLTFTNGSLIITKANATITANSDSKTYNGQTQSVSGFSASGLVNGETVAVLDGVSGATANGTNAGTYTTNLAGSDENYNLTFTNGSLIITKANATITANSDSKTYNGQTQSVSGFSASGLVNGETVAVLDGVSTSGGSGVNAGEYILTPSGTDENYNLTFANGKLIINKANATITANSDSKTYNGQTQSVSGFSASGLVNGETVAVLDGVSTSGGSGVNAGEYILTPSGTDENYNLTFANGKLIINKANATITANSDSKTYNGQTQSVSGFSASGLVNGETVAVLDGVSTSGGSGVNAGEYILTPSGTDENYNLTFANGKLIINKANATITANSDSKTYNGQTQSVSGFSASGLVNGETVAVLDGVSGATANGTNAGTYTTNLAGSDENYNLSFVNGTLTITTNGEMAATVNSVTQNNSLAVRAPQKENAPLPHVKQIGYGINLPEGLENEIYAIADEYKKNKRGN